MAALFGAVSDRLRRAQSCEAGTSAIEFALIAPVLLVMLCGTLAYGTYFGCANSVQQLAADAARASVAGLDDGERSLIARRHVEQAAPSFTLVDPARARVTANPAASNPDLFEVVISYDASRLGVWAFGGLVPMPSKTIVRSAVIQRGGY